MTSFLIMTFKVVDRYKPCLRSIQLENKAPSACTKFGNPPPPAEDFRPKSPLLCGLQLFCHERGFSRSKIPPLTVASTSLFSNESVCSLHFTASSSTQSPGITQRLGADNLQRTRRRFSEYHARYSPFDNAVYHSYILTVPKCIFWCPK